MYNKQSVDSNLNSALSNYIDLRNYVDKDCGDITIGSGGYANLGIYVPNGKTAIFTKVLYWDSSTGGFNVFAYSKYAYIVANPNTVIRGLRVRLYYIDERFS